MAKIVYYKRIFMAFLLIGLSFWGSSFAQQGQVGINTDTPQASLDINGNLRITDVTVNNTATDALVIGTDNIVYRNTNITRSQASQPLSFVSGTDSTSVVSLLNVTLLSGWFQVKFPNEAFDEHSDYSTSTSVFTAPADGIYNIYIQLQTQGVLSVGDFGVGIFTKSTTDTNYHLIANETYTNVAVLGVSTSPTRKTQVLVKLKQNDLIAFGAKTLLSTALLGLNSSFFSIHQVK